MRKKALNFEQRSHGLSAADASDRFAEQRRDTDALDFRAGSLRNGIGGDDFLDFAVGETLVGELAEDRMRDARENAARAVFFQNFCGGDERASGLGHVIDEKNVAAFDFADHVHCFDFGGGNAVFRDDGEFCAESIGVRASHFHAADIGRNDGEIGGIGVALAEIFNQRRFRVEMIDGNIEKSLDLRGVEIHRKHAIDACGGEQIRDELGRNGHARLVFAVLASIAEKGHHRGDALGTGAACGIDHNQQLHDIVIRRRARWLDDENVFAANIFVDANESLAIREGCNLYICKWLSEVFGNILG